MPMVLHKKQTPYRPGHKRGGTNRLVLVIITTILILYCGVQIYSALFSSMRTTPAIAVTVNDSFLATGWIVREETVLQGQQDGQYAVKHLTYSGERVQKGATLSTIYMDANALEISQSLAPMDARLALLEEALRMTGDTSEVGKTERLIEQALLRLSEEMKNGIGSAIAASASELRALTLRASARQINVAALESELTALRARRDQLASVLTGRVHELTADRSGYFSEVIDGYEQVLTPDVLDTLTLNHFRTLTKNAAPPQKSTMGKIISGFSWYLVAEITAEQAKRFSAGQNLRVAFTQASIETPVSVLRVTVEGEKALLILESNVFPSEMASMRQQTIEVILGSYTGLRVPKTAVRLLTDANGEYLTDSEGNQQLGVFILTGTVTRLKRIEPLYQNEEFYVVKQSSTDVDTLVTQDKIVIKGKGLKNNMVVKT